MLLGGIENSSGDYAVLALIAGKFEGLLTFVCCCSVEELDLTVLKIQRSFTGPSGLFCWQAFALTDEYRPSSVPEVIQIQCNSVVVRMAGLEQHPWLWHKDQF
jgi:hypothetical protein